MEANFLQELADSITSVNAFFVDKERELLEQLTTSEADLFGDISALYGFCVLNYLAALKIVKKHDKHSTGPVVEQVRVPSVRTLETIGYQPRTLRH